MLAPMLNLREPHLGIEWHIGKPISLIASVALSTKKSYVVFGLAMEWGDMCSRRVSLAHPAGAPVTLPHMVQGGAPAGFASPNRRSFVDWPRSIQKTGP